MPNVVYQRPWLYPAQQAAIFSGARRTIIEASTKAGKTVGSLIWLFEKALQAPKYANVWWIAPVYSQTRIAFRRLKNMLKDQLPFTQNETELRITLPNTVTIWFKSGEKPDSLFGEDVYAAVIDESSRVRVEAYIAVRTTLTATRGPIVLIGNVRGRKNWFYRLARRAQTGWKNTHYARLTAYDAVEGGVLSLEEIEDAKNELPEEVFNELYMALASEDGSNPFGIQNIEKCISPISDKANVGFGIDLARKEDYTVEIGLDADGKVAHFARYQKPWNEVTSGIIALPRAPILLDSTGVGDPILDGVQRKRTGVKGYQFTSRSKQHLMENLSLHIQAQTIGFPDNIIRTELDDIEYQYTRTGVQYGAPEGLHDDCVMALGLAVLQYDERTNTAIFIGRAA